MNKFLKSDIIKLIDKRALYYKNLRDEEYSKLVAKYSRSGRKGFLGIGKRKPFIPSIRQALIYNSRDSFFPVPYVYWLKKAEYFKRYVIESKDTEYVYLTEEQYNTWRYSPT